MYSVNIRIKARTLHASKARAPTKEPVTCYELYIERGNPSHSGHIHASDFFAKLIQNYRINNF